MILVCSSTPNYFPKIQPFLQGANKYFPGDIYLFCADCEPPSGYLDELPRVQAITISNEQNAGASEKTKSIQHGSFLQMLPDLDENDLIIYSDGDIILQRPFTDDELKMLSDWPINTIGASWNSGPNERLITEARRLSPTVNEAILKEMWGEMIEREPCFNVGVTVARAGAWHKMYDAYMRDWQKSIDTFLHYARQQWLICYAMAAAGLNENVLPFSFHTHAHYGLPFGVWAANGVAYYVNEPIAFRHKF